LRGEEPGYFAVAGGGWLGKLWGETFSLKQGFLWEGQRQPSLWQSGVEDDLQLPKEY